MVNIFLLWCFSWDEEVKIMWAPAKILTNMISLQIWQGIMSRENISKISRKWKQKEEKVSQIFSWVHSVQETFLRTDCNNRITYKDHSNIGSRTDTDDIMYKKRVKSISKKLDVKTLIKVVYEGALATPFSGRGGYASLTWPDHLKLIVSKKEYSGSRTYSVFKVLSRTPM